MTNETISNILERRSVRKYLPDMIEQQQLDAILECGLWAPSGSNTQAWHISVIKNKPIMRELNDKLKLFAAQQPASKYTERILKPDYDVFFDPPLLLLISYDEAGSGKWGATNAALLAENICIAAQSLQVGSLMVGMIYDMMQSEEFDKPMYKQLGIPDGYTPHLFISLGYQDKQVRTAKRPRRENTVSYVE